MDDFIRVITDPFAYLAGAAAALIVFAIAYFCGMMPPKPPKK